MVEINFASIVFLIAVIVWIIFVISQIRLRFLLKRLERTDAELQQLCRDTLTELEGTAH